MEQVETAITIIVLSGNLWNLMSARSQGVLTGVCAYEGIHCLWGTRVIDPFLVHCLEPEILCQVLHCTRMLPIERVEHEDVGIIPGHMILATAWQTLERKCALLRFRGNYLDIT